MTLESNEKAELQYSQSWLDEVSPLEEAAPANQCKSLDGYIRFLGPNYTTTIDAKHLMYLPWNAIGKRIMVVMWKRET
ncbi:MAG: hypothetical protein WA460_09040 [Nitrososphaeraceae archaeon]